VRIQLVSLIAQVPFIAVIPAAPRGWQDTPTNPPSQQQQQQRPGGAA